MLKNYLKIALRNIIWHKGYSAVNVLGLAVGMASFILLLFYVLHELSFDNFHKNGNSIYRAVVERKTPEGLRTDAVTPPPLATALANDFPEITSAVRFLNIDNPVPLLSFGNKRFYENKLFFADPDVFDIFTIPFLSGNPKTALLAPNSLVITENEAIKYFGTDNPIGKTLRLNNYLDLQVTGVIKNFPSNSTVNADFLISFSTLYGWVGKEFIESWQNNMCQTYVLVNKHTPVEFLAKRLPGLIDKHVDKSDQLKNIYFQPLSRIHLYSHQDYNITSGGDIRFIYLLSAIAMFILLIACFNYVVLTTARFIQRARETGVRKLLGATRKQLIHQFLCEGFFYISVSLVIALIVVAIALPNLSYITGKDFSTDYSTHWKIITLPVVLVLFIGLLSGSYTALYFSSLQPVNAIKTQFETSRNKLTMRKALVIGQFVLTNLLVIGSWIVYNQLNFMQNKKLGFDGEQVIVVPIRNENMRQNQDAIKARLNQFPGIQMVAAAALLPGGPVGKTRFRAEGNSETGTMSMLWVDNDFIKTLGIKLAAGRDFSKDFAYDTSESFIINEEAAKQLGFFNSIDAVGKSFELAGSKKGSIIGVVNDFHFTSLQNKIEPVVMHIWPWLNYLLVRVEGKHIPSVITYLKSTWCEFDSDNPFEFSFLNESFNRFYREERQLEKISAFFTSIALFIAFMGLFSLSAHTAERKTKEIGIRKALGASVIGIFGAQLKEFISLVAISLIIALPIGYYTMLRWLQNYAYRVDVDISTILITGFVSLATVLISVSYHAIKAATANPVESLKYE